MEGVGLVCTILTTSTPLCVRWAGVVVKRPKWMNEERKRKGKEGKGKEGTTQ